MSTTHFFSPEYKTEIVLDMLREDEDLTDISEKYNIPKKSLRLWKRQFLERAVSVFQKSDSPDFNNQVKQLQRDLDGAHRKIGELTMQLDEIRKEFASSIKNQPTQSSDETTTVPRYLARLFDEGSSNTSATQPDTEDSIDEESSEANSDAPEDEDDIIDEDSNESEIVPQGKSPPSKSYKMKNKYPIPFKIRDYFDSLSGNPQDQYNAMALYDNYVLMPWLGRKKRVKLLRLDGIKMGSVAYYKHFNAMELTTVCPKSKICKRVPVNIPYLLRDKEIWLPNQVWSIDITYIRMRDGHLYLTAIVDWYSRRVVGWNLSDTMLTANSINVVKSAIENVGVPAIINSDQGAQFKSFNYQRFLKSLHIRQSMCDKARYVDNIMIERWFRSLKTELIYVQSFYSTKDVRRQIRDYVETYNSVRPHDTMKGHTPDTVFFEKFNRNYDFAKRMLAKSKQEKACAHALRRKAEVKKLPGRQVFFSPETMEQIIKEYCSGVTIFEISKKYHHAHDTIQRALERSGVEKYVRPLKYDPDDVIKMYEQRYTIRQIGAKYKVAPRTISAFLKSRNIPVVKNPGGYKINRDNGYERSYNNRDQKYYHK